jgi:energy-coupling factor transporter ATP-binding protein EcfA2
MIHKIEIENFLSVRNSQVVDLRISAKVPDEFSRFARIFPGTTTRAPKIMALYGANASGKTNVLKALNFLIQFVRNPNVRAFSSNIVERFNDEESKNRPIRMAVEFGGLMNATPAEIERAQKDQPVVYGSYRYEVILEVKDGLIQHVAHESLRQRPNDQGKWQRVFERNSPDQALGSKAFPIQGYKHLLNTLDPADSIISNFAQFQHPGALFIKSIAERVYLVLDYAPGVDDALIQYIGTTPDLLSILNTDLNRIDLGIEEMRVDVTPSGYLAKFRHRKLDADMPWLLQSNGTRAFIRLYPVIAQALANGGIAIIDELDLAIHPLVLPEIIKWFHDPGRNPHDAQLWFTGQSVSLLDDLKPEEVLFCEKDRFGCTGLFLASDVARRDDNLQRKYLSGIYGAVPYIG